MSKIIEKAFDASKKIIRSIFKGSPNLITTSDLNRQLEALKYQLDMLDDKTGVVSDIDIKYSLSSGTLTIGYNFSYMLFKGCSFKPGVTSLATNLTKSAPLAYLCLVADKKTVTYDDDTTHSIAGAAFADGTSLPAANQVVYSNEALILVHAFSNIENLVGVVAQFVLSDTGNVLIKKNTLSDKESLSMVKGGVISDFDPNLSGKVVNGKTYDEAFSIIENRFSNIAPDWEFLVTESSGNEVTTTSTFRIQSGMLYLNLMEQKIQISSKSDRTYLGIGGFPSAKKDALLQLLEKIYLPSYGKLAGGSYQEVGFIPYGEFGCFPLFSSYASASTTGSLEQYPIFGMAKLSLILQYNPADSSQLEDAFIGIYIAGALNFSADNKGLSIKAPTVNWGTFANNTDTYVYIPRLMGAIPLLGPS